MTLLGGLGRTPQQDVGRLPNGQAGLPLWDNQKRSGGGMIRHTVVFKLKHAEGSPEEAAFLQAMAKLEVFRQVSKNNIYQFGLSMEFDNQTNYERLQQQKI
jgi:hypothetical protein